ncbi:MAG TPA: glycosyltransferase family 4 protein [Edaphobacter sp.]
MTLRILILNWRCPKNPSAGGAESVTFEIARRLVQQGHEVEWFSAAFPGGAPEETLDGVRIIRKGRQWTVHLAAYRRYRRVISKQFDVVVDEVNTIPFFTPLWAGIPSIMFIHQLAREVWWYESPFPINAIGYLAEPFYLRLYQKVPVVTVSQSTKDDLSKLGFQGHITIIPEGIEPVGELPAIKCMEPTFLYVGRMAPSKRIGDILEAMAQFRKEAGQGSLWLVGGGSERYRESLVRHARQLGIADNVRFCGRVSLGEKHRLMAQAHALLLTSVREGWGLVVTEANACGTPAIVYDVPGLRDSVRHLQTGLVVHQTPAALADGMLQLTHDPGLYRRLREQAQGWSKTFTYESGFQVARDAMVGTLAK